MIAIERAELVDADPVEVIETLTAAGIPSRVEDGNGALLVFVNEADVAAATAVLDGFTPTAARGSYVPPLPPAVRAEAIRIRDSARLSDAQLDSAFPAGPSRQLAYTVRAVCRALIYLVDRRLEDG